MGFVSNKTHKLLDLREAIRNTHLPSL